MNPTKCITSRRCAVAAWAAAWIVGAGVVFGGIGGQALVQRASPSERTETGGTTTFTGSGNGAQRSNDSETAIRIANVEAAKDPPEALEDSVPADVMTDLVGWIADHTDYDVAKTLADAPQVVFAKQGKSIAYEGREEAIGHQLRAAYDMLLRRIYLIRPWSVSNIRDQSTLLHELVHDVQHQNRRWSCLGEPEWQAYKLQEAWLAEHGVQSDFNWTQIFFLSRCPRDIHP